MSRALGAKAHRPEAVPAGRALVRATLVAAAGIYARNLGRIWAVALAIFVPIGVGQEAFNEWAGHQKVIDADIALLIGTGTAVAVLSSTFAVLLFAGLLDLTVAAAMKGRRSPPLREPLLRTPYLRLLAADLLVVAIVVLGLLALVIPGLLAFTLLGLAPALVIAERLPPLRALGRSFHLLRRRLGPALCLVLLPMIAVSALQEAVESTLAAGSEWLKLTAEIAVEATIGALAGLLLAVLAHQLAGGRRPVGDGGGETQHPPHPSLPLDGGRE